MQDYYNNPNDASTKKKFLVPLVALLLCFVSITAVAYAYNSTIAPETDVTTNSYEIKIDDAGYGKIDAGVSLKFNTAMTQNTDGVTAKYTLADDSVNTLVFTLSMQNAKNTADFTIDSVKITGVEGKNVTATSSVEGKTITVTFNIADDTKPVTDSEFTATITVVTSGVEN